MAVFEQCDYCDDDDLDEDMHPIEMTHNEVMYLDDSLTLMLERNELADSVTTMRAIVPSAQLPAPVTLLDKIGMAVLDVTDPEHKGETTLVHLNDSEMYMLREICHSYSKVGKEYVGYNLKRKLYLALYSAVYETNKVADTLLATVDLDIKETAPKVDK